jgi:hypothetical protein
MNAEDIRRRFVSCLGGDRKNDVIDELCKFFANLDSSLGTVEEIAAPAGDYIMFTMSDGAKYEVYNWTPYMDLAETRKKGIELKPLAYRPAGSGGRGFGNFFNIDITIVWFCVFAIWLGLVIAGFVVVKAVFFK